MACGTFSEGFTVGDYRGITGKVPTMARSRKSQPAYQYHVSGQARVTLGGKDFYLGKHNSPESLARYYSLLAEYNANGKQTPEVPEAPPGETHQADAVILVKHIVADYRANVLPNYDHDPGRGNRLKNLCDLIESRHGDEPAAEFGPRKLDALRKILLTKGMGKKGKPNRRQQVNEIVRYVVTIFERGVAQELISPDRIRALEALKPLKRGEVEENQERQKVTVATIEATMNKLTPVMQAMVRIQLATAMRPSEIHRMTPAQIDRSGEVWIYRPTSHKNVNKGKARAIPIIGDALEALTPYVFGDPEELCFVTSKGSPWDKDNYRREITKAAKAAKVAHWAPYSIRHLTLQTVRDAQGPEGAQALAGHSHLNMTERYAKASELKAIEAARVAPRLANG